MVMVKKLLVFLKVGKQRKETEMFPFSFLFRIDIYFIEEREYEEYIRVLLSV